MLTIALHFRRMRKMGLAEGLAYIFGIFTVCQYFINWAAFAEKRFTLREVLGAHAKKMQKKVSGSGRMKPKSKTPFKAVVFP